EDEDDYMSMVIEEPKKPVRETALMKRAREKREAEDRSRVKSKKEREAEAAAAREAAMEKPLDTTASKGFKMMAKFGFKEGGTLGKSGEGRTEPIRATMKHDKGGIGVDTEKKRKIAEAAESEAKRIKEDTGDFRERMREEREAKRLEGQMIGAQKIAERLDAGPEHQDRGDSKDALPATDPMNTKPLSSINVLYRGLIRHRREKERESRMRYDMEQGLSRLPTYEDSSEDEDDKRALGKEEKIKIVEEELEEEDPELDEFNALEPSERVAKLVQYLRDVHNYCFYCKFQYPDAQMEGCPGITEEDHD
ncbi:uncharacterized protein K452DRAFT_199385, partial [Aplosporella prunicola CBS 121167]